MKNKYIGSMKIYATALAKTDVAKTDLSKLYCIRWI